MSATLEAHPNPKSGEKAPTQTDLLMAALNAATGDGSPVSVGPVLEAALALDPDGLTFCGKTPRNSARRGLYGLLDAGWGGWVRLDRGFIARTVDVEASEGLKAEA